MSLAPRYGAPVPALRRLQSLSPLGPAACTAVETAAVTGERMVRQRRELLGEGKPLRAPLLILDGWAGRQRILADGRRQFIDFALPGDVIGDSAYPGAIVGAAVVTLTDVRVCPLPASEGYPDLERAYAVSRALNEARLMAQITRLGRLDARERILDLLLEFHERLSLAGLTEGDGYAIPLTQELFADALGLTSVHVNRTLQQARRTGELCWNGRRVDFPDLAGLRALLGRASAR